jgi:hypothetical protein
LWVVVTAAGAGMAGAIAKLWAHTVSQRDTIHRMSSENLELTNRLHESHKTDLRRFTGRGRGPVELVDVPWAPSRPPTRLPRDD